MHESMEMCVYRNSACHKRRADGAGAEYFMRILYAHVIIGLALDRSRGAAGTCVSRTGCSLGLQVAEQVSSDVYSNCLLVWGSGGEA